MFDNGNVTKETLNFTPHSYRGNNRPPSVRYIDFVRPVRRPTRYQETRTKNVWKSRVARGADGSTVRCAGPQKPDGRGGYVVCDGDDGDETRRSMMYRSNKMAYAEALQSRKRGVG